MRLKGYRLREKEVMVKAALALVFLGLCYVFYVIGAVLQSPYEQFTSWLFHRTNFLCD